MIYEHQKILSVYNLVCSTMYGHWLQIQTNSYRLFIQDVNKQIIVFKMRYLLFC